MAPTPGGEETKGPSSSNITPTVIEELLFDLFYRTQGNLKPRKEALIREPTVRDRTGLATSTLYLRIREGLFPKPIKLKGDGRMSVWISSEVDAWITEQIAAHRAGESQ